MSTNITWPPIGGTTTAIPAAGEVDWPALSTFLINLGNGAQPQTYQKVAIRTATATPVTVASAADCIVVTNLSVAGAVAVTLPAGVAGQYFIIADGKGDAATNNITITPDGAETINGAATYVIRLNRGGVMMSFSGTTWTVLSEFSGVTSGTLLSGTYTPTITNGTNVATTSVRGFNYIRVNNIVFVSGYINVECTAGADTQSSLELSLPIATNFSDATQLQGVWTMSAASGTAFGSGIVSSSAANDTALVDFSAPSTGTRGGMVSFSYRII